MNEVDVDWCMERKAKSVMRFVVLQVWWSQTWWEPGITLLITENRHRVITLWLFYLFLVAKYASHRQDMSPVFRGSRNWLMWDFFLPHPSLQLALQIFLCPIKVNSKVVPESRLLLFLLFWAVGEEEEICRGATSKLSGIDNSCCTTQDTVLTTARERSLLESVAAYWRPNKC